MITSADLDYTPLVCAMIKKAYIEAQREGPYSTAWCWLIGPECRDWCELLGIDHRAIRRQMDQFEAERHYEKPRPVVFLEAFCLRMGGFAYG